MTRRALGGIVAASMASILPIGPAAAAGLDVGNVDKQGINLTAIAIFLAFVLGTLYITYRAARSTRSAQDFYAAGGGISPFRNALAIAGDYMSAASFLGISSLVFSSGFDGLIYSIGFLVGWPIVLFLIAERLRNLGKFTFADVASFRLAPGPVRTLSAIGTLVVVALYLIAQMVGAGQLIKLLFGLDYLYAVVIVGLLMTIYVAFGGMKATTWVQVIKACMLLFGSTVMALAVLWHFGFSLDAMFSDAVKVHPKGEAIMAPGGFVKDRISTISLGVALMFGTAGLPHILMRFFTVKDAIAARKSVFYATGLIGYFYVLTFIIGFGAITFLMPDAAYYTVAADGTYNKITGILGGANMPAVHLANATGGSVFFGFISAVTFATILAVVAGLTLAAASAISHDLYASVIARGRVSEAQEVRLSKISALAIGVLAIFLGYVFEKPKTSPNHVAMRVGGGELQLPRAADVDHVARNDDAGRADRGSAGTCLRSRHGGAEQGCLGDDLGKSGAHLPLRQPRLVLHAARLRRHLALFRPRREPPGRKGAGCLRCAVRPVGDRYRSVDRGGALTRLAAPEDAVGRAGRRG